MPARRFLSSSTRETLFAIPSDTAALEQFYVLGEDDLALVRSRRKPENRLGLAIHLALLRHPGQGWAEGELVPKALVYWISEQVEVSPSVHAAYGRRQATIAAHRSVAIRHLGLRTFKRADFQHVSEWAAHAAFDTDDARIIMRRLLDQLRQQRLVLPTIGTLERIGLTGRARARRHAAQAVNDSLSEEQKQALNGLVKHDEAIGQSRLTWLRGWPHSTSAGSLHGLLARLKYVRALGLPAVLGEDIHPVRLTKFAREGAVAPAHLLSDFGERRRIATLAAQMSELNTVLTDASIAMFEKLTGQLFSRSKNKQSQNWQASQAQVGRLMRLFGTTLQTLSEARESGEDPYQQLDEAVSWERLMSVRPEVDQLSNLATVDPLLLASRRYVQLRKFAPAFMEAFEFELPEAGVDLKMAVQLLKKQNQSRKRRLPDVVPMPFAAKHWKELVVEGGQPVRRVYETAVVATLRDRLRAGDVWVEGSRDYRRFDTYLVPKDEAVAVVADTPLPISGEAWLAEHRERLSDRLREVQRKLTLGQLEGVRLEKGRLKFTPHEAVTPPAGEQLDRAIDAVMPRIRVTELLWLFSPKCPKRCSSGPTMNTLSPPKPLNLVIF
ncbi:MAG: DUF4158 domain-containing protein [Pseudomonadota bacterium]